jgi:hypothetical protein
MRENLGVVAAGLFQGVSQDGETDVVEEAGGQVTVVVDGLGEADHGGGQPRTVEGDGAENKRTEDAIKHPLRGTSEDTKAFFDWPNTQIRSIGPPSQVCGGEKPFSNGLVNRTVHELKRRFVQDAHFY